MKKLLLFAFVSIFTITSIHAQKKKDLLEKIDRLEREHGDTKSELNELRKNEKANESRVLSMEKQVNDLKETNTSLLANMGSFTELSQKKADNLESSLESLKEKDKQINTINDALSKNDAEKLSSLTLFKNAIGGAAGNEANITLKKGSVYITLANSFLFGSDDNSTTITANAKSLLQKIASALNTKSDLGITVEGNSNALKFKNKSIVDNWDLSTRQAASVIRTLQNDFKVDPKKMDAMGKSEYGSESIETSTRILIHPKFDKFYNLVKESMKNAAKQ